MDYNKFKLLCGTIGFIVFVISLSLTTAWISTPTHYKFTIEADEEIVESLYVIDSIVDNDSILNITPKPKLVYDCDSKFISQYYNCPNGAYQNITGKYCNGRLVCENLYEVLG